MAFLVLSDDLKKVYYVDHQEEHHQSRKVSSLLETVDADGEWPEGVIVKPAEAG